MRYIKLKIQMLVGKQCRFRWGSSLRTASSGSTLFANSNIFTLDALRAHKTFSDWILKENENRRVASPENLSLQQSVSVSVLEIFLLTLLHSKWPKLHRVLAILSAIGLKSVSEHRWVLTCSKLFCGKFSNPNMSKIPICTSLLQLKHIISTICLLLLISYACLKSKTCKH